MAEREPYKGEADKTPERDAAEKAGAEPDRRGAGAYVAKPDFTGRTSRKPWLVAAAALLLAGGAFKFMFAPPSAPPSTPAGVVDVKSEKIFPVAPADLDRAKTQAAVSQLKAGKIPPELERAPQSVRDAVRDGRMSLFTVRLMDFVAEDGDIVDVYVDGQPVGQLQLSNTGNVLSIPLTPGKQHSFGVTAVHDGGGGVTFGAQSSAGEMTTRIMGVGESETWTITFR